MASDIGHGHQGRPEIQRRIPLRVLNGVPALMGRHPHRRHGGLGEIAPGEPHGIGAGVIVVASVRGQALNLHIVEPLTVEYPPGCLLPRYPAAVSDPAVLIHGAVDQGAGPHADDHADQH